LNRRKRAPIAPIGLYGLELASARAARPSRRRVRPGATGVLEGELTRQHVGVVPEHQVDALADVDGDGTLVRLMKQLEFVVLLRVT